MLFDPSNTLFEDCVAPSPSFWLLGQSASPDVRSGHRRLPHPDPAGQMSRPQEPCLGPRCTGSCWASIALDAVLHEPRQALQIEASNSLRRSSSLNTYSKDNVKHSKAARLLQSNRSSVTMFALAGSRTCMPPDTPTSPSLNSRGSSKRR